MNAQTPDWDAANCNFVKEFSKSKISDVQHINCIGAFLEYLHNSLVRLQVGNGETRVMADVHAVRMASKEGRNGRMSEPIACYSFSFVFSHSSGE